MTIAKADGNPVNAASMLAVLGLGAEGGEEIVEAPREQYRTEDTIQQLDDLHKRFEAGSISYERFEETKLELLSRLSVD